MQHWASSNKVQVVIQPVQFNRQRTEVLTRLAAISSMDLDDVLLRLILDSPTMFFNGTMLRTVFGFGADFAFADLDVDPALLFRESLAGRNE